MEELHKIVFTVNAECTDLKGKSWVVECHQNWTEVVEGMKSLKTFREPNIYQPLPFPNIFNATFDGRTTDKFECILKKIIIGYKIDFKL